MKRLRNWLGLIAPKVIATGLIALAALFANAPARAADEAAAPTVGAVRSPDFEAGVKAFRTKDYAGAMAGWQKAAAASDPRGQYGVGYLYEFGLGVAVDNSQAKSWYDKAAASRNSDALYALGRMYESGDAGERSLSTALADYRAAAETGSADGAYAVGRMYLRGLGTQADAAQGVVWLRRAADQGEPAAEYMLGAAYEAGWPGHGPALVDAYAWYSKAARADQQALKEADPAFNPKVALASLRHRMTKEQVAQAQTRMRPKAKAVAKAAPKPKAENTTPSPQTAQQPAMQGASPVAAKMGPTT